MLLIFESESIEVTTDNIFKEIIQFFFSADWAEGGLSIPRIESKNQDEQYGKSS